MLEKCVELESKSSSGQRRAAGEKISIYFAKKMPYEKIYMCSFGLESQLAA